MSTALLKSAFPAAENDAVVKRLLYLLNSSHSCGLVQAGTTAGKAKTVNAVSFRVDGALYNKAATDDLWDFTAQAGLGAGVYKAFWLLLSTAGVASIVSGASASSAADALASLVSTQIPDATKSIIGCYVAGSAGSTSFTSALGGGAGTFYDGVPAAAGCLDTLTQHGP